MCWLQLARIISKNNALGVSTSVLEAFVAIRQSKQSALIDHMRLREPTRKLLASNLIDLAERTEAIATAGEASREQLAIQIRAMDMKLEAIVNALGIAPATASGAAGAAVPPTGAAKAGGGGWFQSLMGDASRKPDGAGELAA